MSFFGFKNPCGNAMKFERVLTTMEKHIINRKIDNK